MVEAINKVGHLMGITTIAECVEMSQTFAILKDIGVDYAQGSPLLSRGRTSLPTMLSGRPGRKCRLEAATCPQDHSNLEGKRQRCNDAAG